MCSTSIIENVGLNLKGLRSHSAQGLATISSPSMKIPLPPRLWITDVSDDSSDEIEVREEEISTVEKSRVRSRIRHHKQRSVCSVPIGIFWDIENCQVPRGCSAIDVVAAIRAKFLAGRREADFVVVCDVRKELPNRLQELNDSQVSLIHVCGTQKNAADEKLRQCMRRFGELHSAPAALLLISGDINFAADLSDFRHRKNMEVILVHKQNTSSALIACASSHYCFNELTVNLPRNPKLSSQSEEEEQPSREMEVANLPMDQPPERVSRRLRRLADNCGGKVLRVTAPTAVLRFPTPDHTFRALKRMDGEDVFGRKISTRYARGYALSAPQYSSDEGYSTAPATHAPLQPPPRAAYVSPPHELSTAPSQEALKQSVSSEWALALQQLPAPTPPPLDFCPPPAPRLRRIRGTHGSAILDRSGCSSSNSADESRREISLSRAVSPWNSSASFSEHSEGEDSNAELTVSNLPPYKPNVLQDMLMHLFSEYVSVVRVSVWIGSEGPLATVVLRSEYDARLAISKIHKQRLEDRWSGRRLELSLGRPSPAANLDLLRARLRAILLDQKNHQLPLLRLRDAYASRHCCALTTSDIMKVRDTVVIHEGYGRVVQLVNLTPVSDVELEEAPWKCHIHASVSTGLEDGSRILQPVFIEISILTKQIHMLLENHGGILPLLSLVECYEWQFTPLVADPLRGVPLELLVRSVPGVEVRDFPSRHLTWRPDADVSQSDITATIRSAHSESSRYSGERQRPRTAPALEPMLALFERELVDLLRTAPRCAIPFSKLIPSFHHHFGRQCRVADYGFTKLPDLLAVLCNTVVVLGSGSSRVITLSAAAQSRRWTADLVKLLKSQPGRAILLQDIPQLYQFAFGRIFTPVDYGLCTLAELMQQINPQAVVSADGKISLPRRSLTPDERVRTLRFADEAIELLCYTPNLRMEFSRFVPAYHAHFGRQLRVAHYGCVKLLELFELIPDTVTVYNDAGGERCVKLSERAARIVLAKRLCVLSPVALNSFSSAYASQFGALPTPDILGVNSISELVYAAGGCIEEGMVLATGESLNWMCSVLSACAVISTDRSVAVRGSTEEYFISAFRNLRGSEPDLANFIAAGVVLYCDRHIRLTPAWRTVWRLALLLGDSPTPLTTMEIFFEYTKRYEPTFPCKELGYHNMEDFLRQHASVFKEQADRWSLCAGVVVPRWQEIPSSNIDYSLHDTPPGQKGSRVFESPNISIWCSPPASALPTPTALLTQDKRRIRLAAQFDAV